jgi:hypothetical protein
MTLTASAGVLWGGQNRAGPIQHTIHPKGDTACRDIVGIILPTMFLLGQGGKSTQHVDQGG